MEELKAKIDAATAKFNEECEKAIGGNKAAGARSRKASLELASLLKEWRKVSM